MRINYTPELVDHLEKIKKRCVIVELITTDGDFEITELHTYAADEKKARFFEETKRYARVETAHGCVLLPPYRLDISSEVTFGLKKMLFIPVITVQGIKL